HHVIGGESHQSTSQRHAGKFRLRTRRQGQCLAQPLQQFNAAGRNRERARTDGQRARIEAHLETFAKTNEGVAAQPLTTFHTLEQEARPERGQLGEGRYWCIQVSCDVEWLFHQCIPEDSVPCGQQKTHAPSFRRWVLVGSPSLL